MLARVDHPPELVHLRSWEWHAPLVPDRPTPNSHTGIAARLG
jgi:hypothetical protein